MAVEEGEDLVRRWVGHVRVHVHQPNRVAPRGNARPRRLVHRSRGRRAGARLRRQAFPLPPVSASRHVRVHVRVGVGDGDGGGALA